MDSNDTVVTDGREMEPVNTVTDATGFSPPAYTSNEGETASNYATEPAVTTETEGISQSSQRRDQGAPRDPNMYYDMSGNKYLIVFNHYEYKKWRDKNFDEPSVREGTEKDVTSLENTFRSRGFDVKTHNDCTHEEINKHMKELCEKNHSNTSCVAVAVMTHGIDTYLCAADVLYPLTDITGPLQAVPSLVKKPKLFFIQACREKHIQPLTGQKNTDVPIGADCFYLYSTYRDLVSFRDKFEGAWMMQALCKVIMKHHASLNLMQMVTLINNMVAKQDALLVLNPGTFMEKWRIYKQIPVTESKLEKYLML